MVAIESLLIISLLFGLYAAWNIGANDVSNAMGTSVGSKALTLRQAVIIAAIFEFAGAVFFGSYVSETLQRGLVNPSVFADNPLILVHGMLAALLASGIWLQVATYFGLPVSTTHTIVGAIIGFGAVIGGMEAVYWDEVAFIAGSWVTSPLLGAVTAFLLFTLLREKIFYHPRPLEATKKVLPWIVGLLIIVFSSIILWTHFAPDTPFLQKSIIILTMAIVGGCIAQLVCKKFIIPPTQAPAHVHCDPVLLDSLEKAKKYLQRAKDASRGNIQFHLGDLVEEVESCRYSVTQTPLVEHINTEFHWVEKIFGVLQIVSACLMAFSHGANDVSNAIGPLAAIISILETGSTAFTSTFPTWILAIGGFGIVVGLATWGWRVIETIGKRITELTPSRGFSAEFATALIVLIASRLGCPVSTTHTLVGAVLGVGFAGGLGSLNLKVVRDIILAWIVTIPAGAGLSIACYYMLSNLL